MKGYPPSRGGCTGCRHHRSMHAYEPQPDGLGRMPPGPCTGKDCSCPGFQSPEACMQRLLAFETPEDAKRIRDALEPGWRSDWAGAFTRAAYEVLGKVRYRATFHGRLRGAIGISYRHQVTVEVPPGTSEDGVKLKLYDTHDHISGVVLDLLS